MSLWSRIRMLFRIKTSASLDRLEDPRQVFDYAYEQQHVILRQVRQGLVEVATSKRQLEQQVDLLQARIPKTEAQAEQALTAGREDLARLALQRKQTALVEIDSLQRQLAGAEHEEQKLALAERQLSSRMDDFRTRKEAASARYTAAEAQVRVNEALTGISGDLADLSRALGRAEEKTRLMTARAGALDALIDSGSLGGLPLDTRDPVGNELRRLTHHQAVEQELDELRKDLNMLPRPESSE
ncbi:MAG: PspA/IM30 family protein [Anaerolineales bacterium]